MRLAVKAELAQRKSPAIWVRPGVQDETWIQPRNLSQGEQAHFRQEKGGGVEEIV